MNNENTINSPSLAKGCPKGGVVEFFIIKGIKVPTRYFPNLPCNYNLKENARKLRKMGILSEVIFWQQVKNRQFWGIDFDRQRVIGNYAVDFYLRQFGLVIEIDGYSHNLKGEYDEKRQQYLTGLGLKIFRVQDNEIRHNIAQVIQQLEDFIILNYSANN